MSAVRVRVRARARARASSSVRVRVRVSHPHLELVLDESGPMLLEQGEELGVLDHGHLHDLGRTWSGLKSGLG